MALAEQETNALSQTPFNFKNGVRRNRDPMGKINVPKRDVSIERIGRSRAVK